MNSFFDRNSIKMEEEIPNDGLFYQPDQIQYNYRQINLNVVLIDQNMNDNQIL